MPGLTATSNQVLDPADLTPQQIVHALDQHIVGQDDAKRAVAIAVRNRWRRTQLSEEMRREVAPKNILMIGPTGVGKTEIARRLAKLTGAPFIKVEATKYTEVGYYGRDVESMIRELVDNAIALVREAEKSKVESDAKVHTEQRLLELLLPRSEPDLPSGTQDDPEAEKRAQRTRDKMAGMLARGDLDERKVEMKIEQKQSPMIFGGMGIEQMDMDLQGMLEKIMPKNATNRELTVAQARQVIFEQECEELLDPEKVNSQAIELAENFGMIFVDELDKVVAGEGKSADVSRQGVQRDLLPIVEGTTVQTKHGYIKTDHILFIAAGAFHRNQPSDLMPELQGRFPIRVELADLTQDDFVRILTEPNCSLTQQYAALMQTENLKLTFTTDAIEKLAEFAFQVNQTAQNIGARRLYTIMEKVVEKLSFESPDMSKGKFEIDAGYVDTHLKSAVFDEDLSKFIL